MDSSIRVSLDLAKPYSYYIITTAAGSPKISSLTKAVRKTGLGKRKEGKRRGERTP